MSSASVQLTPYSWRQPPAGDGRAEVAFAVAAGYQGRGLATILLGQLADAAATNGVDTFEAIVLPENRRMLEART